MKTSDTTHTRMTRMIVALPADSIVSVVIRRGGLTAAVVADGGRPGFGPDSHRHAELS